jgi:hypothetical protein
MENMILQGTGLHAHDLVEENHESFLDFFLCQADFLLETKWIGDAIVLLHVVLQGVVEKVEVLLTMAKLVNSLKMGGGSLPHVESDFLSRKIDAYGKSRFIVQSIEEIVVGIESDIYQMLSENLLHDLVRIK